MPDLPSYLTSGASSRAHHSFLVRLHRAESEQEEDEVIDAEVERCRAVLAGRPSLSTIADTLIILLHCDINRRRYRPRLEAKGEQDALGEHDWALVAALQLAERGRDVREKRMGYLYLTERMPAGHELRLMLINTIRKDLVSQDASYKLLALHTIVKLPSPDLRPAVTPLLTGKAFLKHAESAIRQRALQALDALHRQHTGRSDPPFPLPMSKILRLLDGEQDVEVVAVLLRIIRGLVEADPKAPNPAERAYLVERLSDMLTKVDTGSQVSLSVLRALHPVLACGASNEEEVDLQGLDETVSTKLDEMIDCTGSQGAFLLEVCHLPSLPHLARTASACTRAISALLLPDASTSTALPPPNDHVLALRCLTVMPARTWDTMMGEQEMGVVMRGMESGDDTVRRATLRLLRRTVSGLLDQTFSNYLTSLANHSDLVLPQLLAQDIDPDRRVDIALRETAGRALEVVEVLCEAEVDGGRAADMVHALLETCAPEAGVWEEGARRVLDVLAARSRVFQESFTLRLVSLPSAPSHALLLVRAEAACVYGRGQGSADGLFQDLCNTKSADVQRTIIAAIVSEACRSGVKNPDVEAKLRAVPDAKLSKGTRELVEGILHIIAAGRLGELPPTGAHTVQGILDAVSIVSAKLKRTLASPVSPHGNAPRRPMLASEIRHDAYDSPGSGKRNESRNAEVLFDESAPNASPHI